MTNMNINMNNTNPQRKAVLEAQKRQKVSPNSKLIWDYKNSLPELSPFQQAMCTGLLLGDVSIVSNKMHTSHKLKFEWGGKHFDYAKSVYQSLELYCLSDIRTQVRTNINNVPVTTWCFQTVTVPAFNALGQAFLSKGKSGKTLNLYILENLINPISLAYWYIDDGHCAGQGRYGLYLNTQGFTTEEVKGLCEILRRKFQLDCWVSSKQSKKNIPFIVISGNSYNIFFAHVEKYIHTSMRHKFPQGERTQWSILSYNYTPWRRKSYLSSTRWHSLNYSVNYSSST